MTPTMLKDLRFMVFAFTVYLLYNLVKNKNEDTFNLILKVVIIAINIFFLLDVIFQWEFLG